MFQIKEELIALVGEESSLDGFFALSLITILFLASLRLAADVLGCHLMPSLLGLPPQP